MRCVGQILFRAACCRAPGRLFSFSVSLGATLPNFGPPWRNKGVEAESILKYSSQNTTALGSDGQGPQGSSFGFLAFFSDLFDFFYLSFLFGSLNSTASGATSRAPSSRASVRNISFEIELII